MHLKRMIVVVCLVLFAACNRYQPVANSLLQDGQPLAVEGRDVGIGYVTIRLYPIEADGTVATEPASDDMVEADGSFEIWGREGKGVPAGKYRVEVLQYNPYPTDVLQGRFSREKSPIEVELGEEQQSLQIDLADYK